MIINGNWTVQPHSEIRRVRVPGQKSGQGRIFVPKKALETRKTRASTLWLNLGTNAMQLFFFFFERRPLVVGQSGLMKIHEETKTSCVWQKFDQTRSETKAKIGALDLHITLFAHSFSREASVKSMWEAKRAWIVLWIWKSKHYCCAKSSIFGIVLPHWPSFRLFGPESLPQPDFSNPRDMRSVIEGIWKHKENFT